MTDEKKPEILEDVDLEQAQGGITLDNGLKKPARVVSTGDGSTGPFDPGTGTSKDWNFENGWPKK